MGVNHKAAFPIRPSPPYLYSQQPVSLSLDDHAGIPVAFLVTLRWYKIPQLL